MVRSPTTQSRSLSQISWDLIRISRYDKYNSFLALFAGVWSTLLAGSTRLREDRDHISVPFILTRVVYCSLAAYLFSGAGMVWNDWVDRDIDARVARTKDRPLAAGRLRTGEAMIWMLFQAGIATTFMYWMMDGRYVLHSMAPPTLGTLIYPYCKRPLARRIGIYPQYILALTASCPVLIGRASIYPHLESFTALVWSSLPLCLVVFTWTLYFNTAYSYQDIVDDKKLGVNSLYTLAGQHIHSVLVALATIVAGALCWALYPLGSVWLWISWMGVWIIGCVDQMRRFDAKDPRSGHYVFRSNVVMGLWTMVACVLEVVFRGV
ncbi:UbiA prenyltransferase family protein [Aspergillus floccosus]